MPLHVEQAREASASQRDAAPLVSAEVGDARGLVWDDGSVDSVLLLGPLYHLTSRDDRLQALRESCRVIRPGGVVVAAISRFASTYDGLLRGFLGDPGFEEIVERDVREGQHRNPTGRPGWFTTAYFHHPEELRDEVIELGFEVEALVGVEGPGWVLPDLDTWLADPPRRTRLLEAIGRVETEPSLLGASAHILVVGRGR